MLYQLYNCLTQYQIQIQNQLIQMSLPGLLVTLTFRAFDWKSNCTKDYAYPFVLCDTIINFVMDSLKQLIFQQELTTFWMFSLLIDHPFYTVSTLLPA